MIARGAVALEDARADLAGRGGHRGGVPGRRVRLRWRCTMPRPQVVADDGAVIDVWVNNAGVSVFAKFTDMTDAEFRRVNDVTYMGCVNGTRVALEHMKPRAMRGTIVNVCSAIGFPRRARAIGLFRCEMGNARVCRGGKGGTDQRTQSASISGWSTRPAVNTPFYAHAISRISRGCRARRRPSTSRRSWPRPSTSLRPRGGGICVVGGQTRADRAAEQAGTTLGRPGDLGAFGPKAAGPRTNQGVADTRDINPVHALDPGLAPEHGAVR